MQEGLLVIFSAPSGGGKSTLIHRLMQDEPGMAFSVSHTTRAPRPGERDGVDYHFVSEATFDRMLAEGAFVEWARVHGHRYGTSREEVKRLLRLGRDVLFEVDFQGGRALMRRFPRAVSIFVLPPSMAEVRRRLLARGTDSPESVSLRLKNARMEIAVAGEYRYAVVNDDLDRAVRHVRAILTAERPRSDRAQDRIRALVAEEVPSHE